MNNLDAQDFLKEFEANTSVSFIEDSKQKENLFSIAKAKGILITENSKDLAIMKGIYDFAEVPNGNGKRLPSKEILKTLPSLIGKPVTVEHIRRFVIGFIVDYKYIVADKKIIFYAIIFKDWTTSPC